MEELLAESQSNPRGCEKMALNNKQRVFVETYLQGWNATEAAKVAGYSEKTAYSLGSRLLKNVEVMAFIQERMAELKMFSDEVLLLLADQARANMALFTKVTPGGFIYLDFSTPEAIKNRRWIKKLKTKRTRRIEGRGQSAEQWEDETMEVELVDAQVALKMLGSHHGLFTDEAPAVDMHLTIDGLQAVLDRAYGVSQVINGSSDTPIIGAPVTLQGLETVLDAAYSKPKPPPVDSSPKESTHATDTTPPTDHKLTAEEWNRMNSLSPEERNALKANGKFQ
jgi:phage terminase small subunit